jgi:hypothetical protein
MSEAAKSLKSFVGLVDSRFIWLGEVGRMCAVCGSGVVDTAINYVLHTIQYKAADSLPPSAGLVGSTIHEWLASLRNRAFVTL